MFTEEQYVPCWLTAGQVHALIGTSGCGKSTFLRTVNRMHEMTPGAWVVGRVLLGGQDVYAPGVSAMQLRRRVGMVFQTPSPFPTMSSLDNGAAGLRRARPRGKRHSAGTGETARRR